MVDDFSKKSVILHWAALEKKDATKNGRSGT